LFGSHHCPAWRVAAIRQIPAPLREGINTQHLTPLERPEKNLPKWCASRHTSASKSGHRLASLTQQW
jgi:hypothetical protein